MIDADSLVCCCGVLEIGNFGGDKECVEDDIRDIIQCAKGGNFAMILATTVPPQKVARAALKKFGFKIVEQCHRPDKDRKIAVHILTLGSKR